MVDGKFPVDTNHFSSPPNSLRLKWTSAPGGDWQMKLKSAMRYGRDLAFEGDTLSFWCYSETEMPPDESPWITLQDKAEIGSGTIRLLADYGRLPAGKWVRISIPIENFKPLFQRTEDFKFDPGRWRPSGCSRGLTTARNTLSTSTTYKFTTATELITSRQVRRRDWWSRAVSAILT